MEVSIGTLDGGGGRAVAQVQDDLPEVVAAQHRRISGETNWWEVP